MEKIALRTLTCQFLDPVFTRAETESLLRRWLVTCEANGASEATLAFRNVVVKQFLWWMDSFKHEQFSTEVLELFFAYLHNAHKTSEGRWVQQNKSPLRPQTIANYFREFKAWGNWMVRRKIVPYSPTADLDAPQFREDKIEPFSPSQLNDLLAAASRTRAPHRNRALLLLMLDTGVRCTEARLIQFCDIDLDERQVKVLGKGNKHRTLPFSPRTSDALFSYLLDEPIDDPTQYLFRAERGGNPNVALERRAIGRIYERLGAAAGIEQTRCSPHTMRSTFAIMFLRAGGSIETLQQLLGHTDLSMTMRYVKIANADIREQHRRHSPVDALLSKKKP